MALPALLLAPLIAQGVAGLAQAGVGIGHGNKADELRKAVRPQYSIEDEYYDNVDIASYLAQSGLTQGSKDYYGNAADRGLSRFTDVALQTGGGLNQFSNLYDTYLQNQYKIAAEDSQLQTQNIQNLLQQNINLAGQKTMQWSINELEPYKDTMKAAAAAEDASSKNIWGGVNSVIGAGAAAATAASQNRATATVGAGEGVRVPTSTLVAPTGYGQQSIAPPPVAPVQSYENEADYGIYEMLKKLRTTRFTPQTNYSNVA